MNIITLIDKVREMPNCIVYHPCGYPRIEHNNFLPDDILEFYNICDGIELFTDYDYNISIVPPNKFELANPIG